MHLHTQITWIYGSNPGLHACYITNYTISSTHLESLLNTGVGLGEGQGKEEASLGKGKKVICHMPP